MSTLDQFRLEGKRALVTGASRGLGRVMALALADAGADVVITGRTEETLEADAWGDSSTGSRSMDVQGRHGRAWECQGACERVLEDAGPIDILINNVGNREVNVAIEAEGLGCLAALDRPRPHELLSRHEDDGQAHAGARPAAAASSISRRSAR